MADTFCFMDRKGTGQIQDGPPASGLSGSVGQGGANRRADVSFVQSLLNFASAALGSPRQPLTVDGLIGPKTIGAIREFQGTQLGFQDCRVDQTGPTLARLLAAGGTTRAEAATLSIREGGSRMTRIQAAMDAVPLARFWTGAATLHLQGLLAGLKASGGLQVAPFLFGIVNTHFHLDRDPSQLPVNLDRLIRTFTLIGRVLGDASNMLVEGDSVRTVTDKDGNIVTIFADAPFGGFHRQPNVDLRVNIRPPFVDCGQNTRAAMLIHECAHFVGGPGTGPDAIRHKAAEFPVPDGQKLEGSGNYRQLAPAEAVVNAAGYSSFATHAATSIDQRFGGRDILL